MSFERLFRVGPAIDCTSKRSFWPISWPTAADHAHCCRSTIANEKSAVTIWNGLPKNATHPANTKQAAMACLLDVSSAPEFGRPTCRKSLHFFARSRSSSRSPLQKLAFSVISALWHDSRLIESPLCCQNPKARGSPPKRSPAGPPIRVCKEPSDQHKNWGYSR